MITVEGRSYVSARVDGYTFPDSIHLVVAAVRSHPAFSLPTLTLIVLDTNRELQNRLVEGAQIEILIAQKKENNADWMPFRVFSYSPSPVPTYGMRYIIHGYWDYKSYLYDKVVRSYSGNSSFIIRRLAEDGGLRALVDETTEDAQWYCPSKTLAEFVRQDVVPMSHGREDGYMMSVIDARTRAWCYRDLNLVTENNQILSRLVNSSAVTPGEYNAFFSEYEYHNDSGYSNRLAYSMKNAVYNAVTGTYSEDADIRTVKTDSRLSVNTRDLPELSHVLYSTLDFGNNGNGPKNRGRNLRQSALWSIKMDVLLSTYTTFPLLTLHHIDVINGQQGKDERQSGRYVCVGRVLAATKSDYKERLCFIRNSENVDNSHLP